MKKIITIALAQLIAALAFSCGGGGETDQTKQTAPKTESAAETGAYKAVAVTDGGSITGRVTFSGAVPPKQKLEVTKDVAVCSKEPHYKEDLVVSSSNGLANVVVSISNISAGKDLSSLGTTFAIDQNGCAFKPHVVLIPTGAELTIKNSDGILHNIHTYSELNSPVNVAQPGFNKEMKQTFDQAEFIRVTCDVHNWMGAYVCVVDHPYYVVTDSEGNFELIDVPAGTYSVEFWQESLGKKSMEVTVTAGAAAEANMEFTVGS
ncbi:MAG: carboxypeptidase regulatory-like domain-containing protein [bacterium]